MEMWPVPSSQHGATRYLCQLFLSLAIQPPLILFSALERIGDKLQGVSGRVENAGRMEGDDAKVVSEVMDEIRAIIIDCKVSSEISTRSAI